MLCAGHLKKKKMVRCHKVGGIALTIVCKLKVRRPFSSLSREMLTFSRLIQHNPLALRKHYLNGPPCTRSTLVGTATTNCHKPWSLSHRQLLDVWDQLVSASFLGIKNPTSTNSKGRKWSTNKFCDRQKILRIATGVTALDVHWANVDVMLLEQYNFLGAYNWHC